MKRHSHTIQIAYTHKQLFKWLNSKRHNKIRHKWLSHLKHIVLLNSSQLEYRSIHNLVYSINEELLILEEDIEIETNLVTFYKDRFEYRAPIG